MSGLFQRDSKTLGRMAHVIEDKRGTLRACLVGKCSIELGFLEMGRLPIWFSGAFGHPWFTAKGQFKRRESVQCLGQRVFRGWTDSRDKWGARGVLF